MKYRKPDNHTYVISLAPGEEIIEKMDLFLDWEKISNAYFTGIGAVKKLELAHYRVDNRKYSSKIFEEPMEIANMTGNVFLFDGKPLVHVHGTFSNDRFETFAGHLVKGIISAACEIILIKLDSDISKKLNEEIGLKLLNIMHS